MIDAYFAVWLVVVLALESRRGSWLGAAAFVTWVLFMAFIITAHEVEVQKEGPTL